MDISDDLAKVDTWLWFFRHSVRTLIVFPISARIQICVKNKKCLILILNSILLKFNSILLKIIINSDTRAGM